MKCIRGQAMNPRWELYKKANNIKSDEGVKGSDYIIWITSKVDGYLRTHKIEGYFTAKQNAKFEEWLKLEVAKCE